MTASVSNVPILRIPFTREDTDFIHDGLDRVLGSGYLSGGKNTAEFEERFAAFTGATHAVSCNSGTSSIELILRGLQIENRAVIVPTNTFMATALAAVHAGNRVVFADSDPETLCLDVADVARKITPDAAAVITVHIGGVVSPAIRELQELCAQKGIALIEDCAHAHGSAIGGQHAGTIGVAGSFSFFATKVMTTGEGGMVTTNDPALAARMRMVRNHGKNPEQANQITEIGSNYRMSELTALMGVQQMHAAEANLASRRRAAAWYDAHLSKVDGVTPVHLADGAESGYYKYLAYLDEDIDRAALKSMMKDEYGVSLTGEVYADLCHREPVWNEFTLCGRRRSSLGDGGCGHGESCSPARRDDSFEGAEYISRHHICPPAYAGLTDGELDHVVSSLRASIERLRSR